MEYWLKLYIKFLNWEWYKDTNTKSLFLHLLLTANRLDGRWQGIEVKRGQLVTSLKSLSEKTGLSIGQIRVALKKLKLTNEITNESHSNFRLITVLNYDRYQDSDKGASKRVANERQTNSKRVATIEEVRSKNIRNIENTVTDGFENFWTIYPKKSAKATALKSWLKLTDDQRAAALEALPNHLSSNEWIKDGGQFIPYPATWLNQSRWQDEITTFKPTVYAA